MKQSDKEYQKRRYHENLEESRERARKKNLKTRERNRRYVLDYLASHPCVDCGESDLVVLEFDHVRGEKKSAIAELIGRASLEKIQEEVAKCDVRCANCHRRKTAKDFSYYRESKPEGSQG